MNRFKVGALGALMVLGGSVYGMDKDTELTESLMQHAQPVSPGSTVYGSVAATPEGMPERDERIAQQANCFTRLKASLVDGCKKVKSSVHACWKQLPRWGKDTAEMSILAGASIGMAVSPQGNSVAMLAAEAVGKTATDITARQKWYYKLPTDAVIFGGCELLKYAGMDPWTVTLSSIMYAIESIYSDYAICNGRKTTLGEDFRDLSPANKKMVEERIDQIRECVEQELVARAQADSTPVAPQGTCGRLKKYASKLSRGVKDSIEMSGLLALDFLMYGYNALAHNVYFPMLTAYAAGQTCADITERHAYPLRLLGCGLVAGCCEGLKYATEVDFWTISLSAIMCAVQATLDDYAVITGRKTTFADLFKTWPLDIQEKVIACLVRIGKQARAIEEGRVAPLQPVKTDIESTQADLASIALFAEDNTPSSSCQRLSRGKKDALELTLIGATCAGFDAMHCGISGCSFDDKDWLASVLVAYAAGKSTAQVTEHYPYYVRMLGGLAAWSAAVGVAWTAEVNISTLGIAPIMHMVNATFMEYARKTDRTNGYVESFRNLPKEFQRLICKKFANEELLTPKAPIATSIHLEDHK